MDINKASYHDFSVFNDMRRKAQHADGETVKDVSKQFEGLFVQMMLKSMRDTLPEGGLFDDSNLRFYQDMLDKELSQSMVEGKGIGLAKVIEQQLSKSVSPEESALRQSLSAENSSLQGPRR